MRKLIVSAIERENSFIHVNTVSNYLNFALQNVFLS